MKIRALNVIARTSVAFFKMDTGQYEDALPLGLRIVELDPNGRAYGHHLVGLIQLYTYNYEAAVTSFRKNLELNPGLAITRLQLARTEVARRNYAEAIRGLQTAEQLAEGQRFAAGWIAMMAEAYGRSGRSDDASRLIAELNRREEVAPIDDAVWAVAALARSDYEEARRRLKAATDARELTPGLGGQTIKSNVYQDPVLEGPQWRELRDQIYALD